MNTACNQLPAGRKGEKANKIWEVRKDENVWLLFLGPSLVLLALFGVLALIEYAAP
jgi:hypothetical protein